LHAKATDGYSRSTGWKPYTGIAPARESSRSPIRGADTQGRTGTGARRDGQHSRARLGRNWRTLSMFWCWEFLSAGHWICGQRQSSALQSCSPPSSAPSRPRPHRGSRRAPEPSAAASSRFGWVGGVIIGRAGAG